MDVQTLRGILTDPDGPQPFEDGAFHGFIVSPGMWLPFGDMEGEARRETLTWATYAVYSNGTPIGWVHRGLWTFPLETYGDERDAHSAMIRQATRKA